MRLINLLKKFQNQRILVIGDMMLDTHLIGTVDRISPEAPVPIVLVKREEYALGGAANLANNIVSLNGNASLIGIIGNDREGQILTNKAKEKGINLYTFSDDRPTTAKTRIIAQHQQVVRVDNEKTNKIGSKTEKAIIDLINKEIKNYDAIILSDYNKGIFTENLTQYIIKLSKRNQKIVISAPKSDIKLFRNSYLVCVNKKEAEGITKIKYENGNKSNLLKTLSFMGENLAKKANSRYVVITCGEDGMFSYSRDGKKDYTLTIAQEISDVTGAGDTALAALSLSLRSGADIHNAARLANYAAGLKVQKLGVKPVTMNELENLILNINQNI